MTTLPDRDKSALVVIDVQNDVVAEAFNRDTVVANIAGLVERARAEDVPVVWVQHSDDGLEKGSPGWEYVPELRPADDEPLVHKSYGDSFEETPLEQILAERNVGHLIITGAETDACIRSTLHGAITRGYDVTLVGDAHASSDATEWGSPPPDAVVAFTNLYWNYHRAPGRRAQTVTTAEVDLHDAP